MKWPSLSTYFKAKVSQFRDRVLLRDFGTDRAYTYGEADNVSDEMGGALRNLGVHPGDRVALLHPNHSDFILAYFAIIKAGAVAVPINTLYTSREILHILTDSEASCLISTKAFENKLKEIKGQASALKTVLIKDEMTCLKDILYRQSGARRSFSPLERSPDDLAFIFYTSGTTGRPKGVMLTHRNVTFGGANTAQSYGLRETDVALACLPLVHIFANASPVFGSLNSGGSIVVMERFQTEMVYDALANDGVTWFPGVPTMFGYLLNAFNERPRSVRSLRMGLSGGASLSGEHLMRFEELFQAPVLEVYGLTESTGLVTANPVYGVRKTGSIGISAPGIQVRLVTDDGREVHQDAVGEISFKGPNSTPGYWRLPQATEQTIRDGWVYTGDLARGDEEGYFFVVGRKNELIISGGYNVYPREIEEVLYLHEGISEAAVVGVTDPDLGEVPKAFVAPKVGCDLKPDDIIGFCRQHLAAYKTPKSVEILKELPKNSTGKILKSGLQR